MTTIDQTALCSIPLVLPPLSIQRNFARRFAAVETLKTMHRASLAEMDVLFASLQDQLLKANSDEPDPNEKRIWHFTPH